ncbi:compass complex subunit [Colletotrichum plurivorum]|uniref:Compass complex subunit n=1 Tax=Colletotrichum plurivorum TaxID=2175906 RepID=A0A8H6JU57_9PEZI|nr:compass complex subunit [Colletotrichum plurivorum]
MSDAPRTETPIPPPYVPHTTPSAPPSAPPSAAPPTPEVAMPPAPAADVSMADASDPASSPAPAPPQAAAAIPSAPTPRTGTPSRNANNGDAGGSRAGSVHPDPSGLGLPTQATNHGDSARMYINANVTAALLEGMKIIGKDQPPNPLQVLGEFLLHKSRERGEYRGEQSN